MGLHARRRARRHSRSAREEWPAEERRHHQACTQGAFREGQHLPRQPERPPLLQAPQGRPLLGVVIISFVHRICLGRQMRRVRLVYWGDMPAVFKPITDTFGVRLQPWPLFALGFVLFVVALVFMPSVVSLALGMALFLAPLWLP